MDKIIRDKIAPLINNIFFFRAKDLLCENVAPVINNTFSFIKQFQENLFTLKLKLQNASTGYNVKNMKKQTIKGE